MSVFRLARNPPQWLRVALASLMLAFALNSVAHVTHRHDSVAHHQLHNALCGYCLSFDNMTPAPAAHALVLAPQVVVDVAIAAPAFIVARFALTSAQPRAPPLA